MLPIAPWFKTSAIVKGDEEMTTTLNKPYIYSRRPHWQENALGSWVWKNGPLFALAPASWDMDELGEGIQK